MPFLVLLLYLIPSCILAVGGNLFTLDKQGRKVFPPDEERRILVEDGKVQMFFLLGSRYALVNGELRELASPVGLINGQLYIPNIDFSSEPKNKQAIVPVTTVQSNVSCSASRPVKRIFLDPGHGGNDLGTSFGSLHEKDIVLGFARLVEKELKALGFEVMLSRSRDVFLPLDIRPQLAQKWGAQAFISIHMNSSPSHAAHGTETYILSADATDAEARKLAVKENFIVSHAKTGDNINDILWDMQQTVYLQDSAILASKLQQSIVGAADSNWKNRGVRQAPFFVLSRAAMPSVLVELAYLSNSRDRVYLSSKKFQEKLAKALAGGVKMYGESCSQHK